MGKSYSSTGADPVEPFEFDLDGVHFVCDGALALLDLSELAELADEDTASPAGVAALSRVFKAGMSEQTYAAFKAHTRAHRTDPDVQLEIMGDLLGHLLRGHSRRPSPSSPGPHATNGGSVDSVPWPGLASPELPPETLARIREGLAR